MRLSDKMIIGRFMNVFSAITGDYEQIKGGRNTLERNTPHQFLHAGNSAVGVAQRVSESVNSVTGLSIPIETNGNASAVERPKREWA